MEELLLELKNLDCNIDEAMERFLDDAEFYTMCLKQMLIDENFERLGVELDNGNVSDAFDCAHTLKGIISNLGITPMYNIILEIVEPLRQGSIEGLSEFYQKLIKERETFKNLAEKY